MLKCIHLQKGDKCICEIEDVNSRQYSNKSSSKKTY